MAFLGTLVQARTTPIDRCWRLVAVGECRGDIGKGSVETGRIGEFTLHAKLPSIYADPVFATAGGLMSYGPNFDGIIKGLATYIDKIFKGAKPADLPVEQPTKFELVVNLKTAKAIGLKIPESFLLRADEVIE